MIDLFDGLRLQLDAFWYQLLLSLSSLHWSVLRGFIMMGYTLELLQHWLATQAFIPLLQATQDSLRVAVSLAFVVALLVLGVTYLLAALIRLDIVQPRSALTWYIAGALFFTVGPSFYRSMSDFRSTVQEAFYLSTLNGLQARTGDTFRSLEQVQISDLETGTPCDHLGTYLPAGSGRSTLDGLDIALAYLRADGIDVMGYHPATRDLRCPAHPPHPATGTYTAGPIPFEWTRPGSFFDELRGPVFFETMTDLERQDVLAMASAAQARLLTAWPLVLFGVMEQLVYLLLTVAQGLTFISFAIAILFAFFKRTEVIAQSVLNQWVELLVQTVIIALIQALVVSLFLAGAAGQNGLVILGIGLICLVFMVIVLWSGVKAVWNSFNRLFGAMGAAAGGTILTPGTAALAAAGGAAAAVAGGAAVMGAATSAGSNALAGMTALQQGSTAAQAAGLTFGGSRTLSGAARTLTHLPGLHGTALADAAEQFSEGAAARTIARPIPWVGRTTGPLVGAMLLTDRDPEAAQRDAYGRVAGRPMLIPAVGDTLRGWTLPQGTRAGVHEESETSEKPKHRMGVFTPLASFDERQAYDSAMQGEEMEQHLSERLPTPGGADARLDTVAARLEASADALLRAAQAQVMVGQLRVSGTDNVAGVMADVIRLARLNTPEPQATHLAAAGWLGEAVGVRPLTDGQPPVREDLTRFGLFTGSALALGLSPEQTETVIREVKTSPEGTLGETTRAALVEHVHTQQGGSWETARESVGALERHARLLPDQIIAVGQVTVAPEIAMTVNPAQEPESAESTKALAGRSGMIGGQP